MENLDSPVSAVNFQVVHGKHLCTQSNGVVGSKLLVSALPVESQPSFQSLRHLFKVLERSDFLELANHTLKGDQVIVRGSDVTTVTSIIDILKVDMVHV